MDSLITSSTSSSPLVEGLKEVARLVLLAVVSWLLTGGIDIVLASLGTGISPEFRVLFVAVITVILKAIDKFLHEKGKSENNTGYLGERGITYI